MSQVNCQAVVGTDPCHGLEAGALCRVNAKRDKRRNRNGCEGRGIPENGKQVSRIWENRFFFRISKTGKAMLIQRKTIRDPIYPDFLRV